MGNRKLMIAATCAALFGNGVANAGLIPFPFQVTSFEDSAIDFFTVDNNNDGLLDVGDVLTAVIEVERLENALGPGVVRPSDYGAELTGLSVIEVKQKTPIAGLPGQFTIVFGPAASGLWPNATSQATAAAYAGAMIALWEDASQDLDVTTCTSIADCASRATNGTQYQVDGMPGVGQAGYDADNQWSYTGPDNALFAASQPASNTFGSANFLLSNLFNLPGPITKGGIDVSSGCGLLYNCAGDGKVDVLGSTDIKGGQGLTNGAFARANFAFQKVPAPAPIALIAIGLLGLVARRHLGK